MTRLMTGWFYSLLTALALALTGSLAHAGTIYTYSVTDPDQMSEAGEIDTLSVSYDTDEYLSFSLSIGRALDGGFADGGWFVLSPGNYPQVSGNQLAIFFMDFAGGDLYAYRYNGVPGTEGYGAGTWAIKWRFITAYEDVLSVDQSGDLFAVSFDNLDISALAPGAYGPNWTGASFGEMFGGWFHFAVLDAFAVTDGKVSAFKPSLFSWYDTDSQYTTVPEPGSLAMIGILGVLGLAVYRRRKARGA